MEPYLILPLTSASCVWFLNQNRWLMVPPVVVSDARSWSSWASHRLFTLVKSWTWWGFPSFAETSTERNEKGIDWFTKSVGCVEVRSEHVYVLDAQTSIGLRKVAVTSTPPQAMVNTDFVEVNFEVFSAHFVSSGARYSWRVRTLISFCTSPLLPPVTPIQVKVLLSTLTLPIHGMV